MRLMASSKTTPTVDTHGMDGTLFAGSLTHLDTPLRTVPLRTVNGVCPTDLVLTQMEPGR